MLIPSTKQKGFTIVELLIVIVVIAILAAITIVAYNGIQQRAKNTAIISAAKSTIGVINAYVAANGSYPSKLNSTVICLTTTSGCAISSTTYGGNSTLDTNLATMGTVPRSIPMNTGSHYGVLYDYGSSRTYDGTVQPVIVYYWLDGTAQQCGLSGVVSDWATGGAPSTTGYTAANDTSSGRTLCAIHVAGPTS